MATVSFESFIKEQGIEIPAIQRDYVQGRGFTIEEIDKREAFVNKLINAISSETNKPCHLEFIYGSINATSQNFIPLDGQQRLLHLAFFFQRGYFFLALLLSSLIVGVQVQLRRGVWL